MGAGNRRWRLGLLDRGVFVVLGQVVWIDGQQRLERDLRVERQHHALVTLGLCRIAMLVRHQDRLGVDEAGGADAGLRPGL